jgi:hypothetical protein
MGELTGIDSIIEAWRARINDEATPFVVTADDKEFVKTIFPNRKFKSGCKDCYKDVIIELVTQGLPAEPVVFVVTDEANFVLCEKTFKNGFAVFVGKDKKRFSIENEEGKTPATFSGAKHLCSSDFAKRFFAENPNFHRYLKQI